MQCTGTIQIKRRDKHGERIVIPCGQCLNCRINKRDQLVGRCLMEHQISTSGQFWTLTFDDLALRKRSGIARGDRGAVRRVWKTFLKELRAYESRMGNPIPPRSFGVCEYGTLWGRPHIHALIWNQSRFLDLAMKYVDGRPLPRIHIGQWPHGHIDIQEINPKSCRYVAKYCTKFEETGQASAPGPIVLYPRKPSLGYYGLVKHAVAQSRSPTAQWEKDDYITLDGKTWALDQHTAKIYRDMCFKLRMPHKKSNYIKRSENRLEMMIEEQLRGDLWHETRDKKTRERERTYQRNLDLNRRRQENMRLRLISRSLAAQSISPPTAKTDAEPT